MNIFNSLGSNYNFRFALKVLLSKQSNLDLKSFLENKYQGKLSLVYKGREAIELGLKSLNLEKGSFVAINGFTCFAVYDAVTKTDLEIEYLDIDELSLNFSPKTLSQRIQANPKIKAVIIQNTLGYPCQIQEISQICKDNKIVLIEDLAHSIGTKYENGTEAGTVGDLVVLSFSQDKLVDGISGGALIVRNPRYKVSQTLANIRPAQELKDRFYPIFTYLIRLTYPFMIGEILHLILKVFRLLSKPMDGGGVKKFHKLSGWYTNLIKSQFDKLNGDLLHRKAIAEIYARVLNPELLSKKITSQIQQSVNLRFPIFVKNRADLVNHLKNQGIYVSDIWYDCPIGPKKYLKQTNYQNQCPVAEQISTQILNLPTHNNISPENAVLVSKIINQWLKS